MKKIIFLFLIIPYFTFGISKIEKTTITAFIIHGQQKENISSENISTKTYKIDDEIIFIVEAIDIETNYPSTNGRAIVDIGIIRRGIELPEVSPGKYEGKYKIKEGDNITTGAPIICHFVDKNRQKAQNDGIEAFYVSENKKINYKLTIDAQRPVITNFSVTPTPFNPLLKTTEITYYLNEDCSEVVVKIKNAKNIDPISNRWSIQEGEFLNRTIGIPQTKFGENRVSWDGKDEKGNFINLRPETGKFIIDGDYIYKIMAKDKIGNEAIPVTGTLKISVVNVLVKNLYFAPDPAISEHINIDFEAEFRTTMKKEGQVYGGDDLYQLANLAFYPISKQGYLANGDDMRTARFGNCWAMFYVTSHKTNGEKIRNLYPDWTPDTDMDGIWVQPMGGEFDGKELGNPSLKDKGDGDKTNDLDTLCRFTGIIGSNIYTTTFKGLIKLYQTETEEKNTSVTGVQIIRIFAELAGRYFWRISDEEENKKEEKWHIKVEAHYGNISPEYFQGTFRIYQPGFFGPDNTPPTILSVYPSGNVSPGEIGGEGIGQIQPKAVLTDGITGSGVDLINSTIKIYRIYKIGNVEFKEEIGGDQENNGVNTITKKLYKKIIEPGEYLIEIKAKDVIGLETFMEVKFTVQDKSAPIFAEAEPQTTENNPRFEIPKELHVTVQEPTGESGLLKDSKNYTIKLYRVKNGEEEEIKGTTTFEPVGTEPYFSGTIKFTFKEGVVFQSGKSKYRWEVYATDKAGNTGLSQYEFYLLLNYKEIKLGENIYLRIPGGIEKTKEGYEIKNISVSTATINTKPSDFTIVGPLIEFNPNSFSFGDIQVELIMHYTNEDIKKIEVPIFDKNEIKIYNYDGFGWKEILGNVEYQTNKVSIKLNSISGQYALMYYIKPVEIKKAEEGYNFFNPNKNEKKVFEISSLFPDKKIIQIKLKVYSVNGSLITSKNYSAGEEKIFWDGKNDKGKIVLNGVYILIFEAKDDTSKIFIEKRLVAVLK